MVRTTAGKTGRGRAPAPRTDRALLLRRTPYGETSLVIHVLTARNGRIEMIAKGAHRPKSRFCGVLDWLDTLELTWAGGERSGLAVLRSGDLAARRRAITRSLPSYRAGQTIVELLDIATRAGAVEGTLFELGQAGLDALDASWDSEPEVHAATLAAFELKLLTALGLAPALTVCAACGEDAPTVDPGAPEPRAPFSAAAGGRLCPLHANEAYSAGTRVGTLPEAVLRAAREALRAPLAPADRVPLPAGLGLRVLDFAGRFLDHHLETRPKSHRRLLAAPDRNRRADRTSRP